MKRDFQLLLGLVNAENGEKIKLLLSQANNNFQILWQQLLWHKVLFIIDARLNDSQFLIDSPYQQEYKNKKHQNLRQALQAIAKLKALAAAFQQANLDFLVFKGLVLSSQLYGSAVARNSRDIDILLRSDDLKKAHHILLKLGYSASEDAIQPDEDLFEQFQLFEKDITYLSSDEQVAVEIHWRLDKNPESIKLDFDTLWAERIEVQFSGLDLQTFGYTHRAIHLLVHGSISMWGRLFWLYDWHTLLMNNKETDWNFFLQLVKQQQMTRMLALSLSLCKACFNTEIPDQLRDIKSDWVSRQVAKLITKNMQRPAYAVLIKRVIARFFLKSEFSYKRAYAKVIINKISFKIKK